MPDGAAHCPDGGKFGRPHEVDGLERVEDTQNQGGSLMERYIQRENLSLFKKRLAEPHTDAEREVLMKLLTDEQAKETLPKNEILKPR